MKFLLDTCVVSEYAKSKPNRVVIDWLDTTDKNALFISIITIAELKKGCFKAEFFQPQRHKKLALWIMAIEQQFSGRILAIDNDILTLWAKLTADSERHGICLPIVDTLLAATALIHNMTVVTRNVNDFKFESLPIFNPWEL